MQIPPPLDVLLAQHNGQLRGLRRRVWRYGVAHVRRTWSGLLVIAVLAMIKRCSSITWSVIIVGRKNAFWNQNTDALKLLVIRHLSYVGVVIRCCLGEGSCNVKLAGMLVASYAFSALPVDRRNRKGGTI